MSHIRAFTLIELLIVISIIAILGSATVMVLNPVEMMRQSRDGTRIQDIENIDKGLKMALFDNPTLLDSLSASNIYVSRPSSSCPSGPPAGFTYVCNASTANLNKTDGTGWIPLALSNVPTLPIDPNASNSNFYYAFVADPSTKTYVITSLLESEKQLKNAAIRSGGYDPSRFEKGNVTLWDKANGLVGYWPMDEGQGVVAYDKSGNGNNGTWTGTQAGTSGYYSAGKTSPYAGYFNGSDDYINCGADPSLTPQNITISAWVKSNAFSSWNGIISNMTSWGTGFSLQIGTSQKIAAMIAGNYLVSSFSPQTGIWYHVVATHNNSTNVNILYVNGKEESRVTLPVSYEANAKTYIGVFYTSPNLLFNGLINDVKIYNRVLSSNEILSLYNSQK